MNLNGKVYPIDSTSSLYTIRYSDKSTPYQTVGLLLFDNNSQMPSLQSFVMSCRFFSRGLEYVSLYFALQYLGASDTLCLPYINTGKNKAFTRLMDELIVDSSLPAHDSSIYISSKKIIEKAEYYASIYNICSLNHA